jgi:hypothetical protein
MEDDDTINELTFPDPLDPLSDSESDEDIATATVVARYPVGAKKRTPYSDINERKRKGKNSSVSDEVILEGFDSFFEDLATTGSCIQPNSTRFLKCDCLGILEDKSLQDTVSRFALSFGERTRLSRLESAIDWCRYAKPTPKYSIGNSTENADATENAADTTEISTERADATENPADASGITAQ